MGIPDDGGSRIHLRVQMVGEAKRVSAGSSIRPMTATSLPVELNDQRPSPPIAASQVAPKADARRSIAAVAPNVASNQDAELAPVTTAVRSKTTNSAAAPVVAATTNGKGTKKKASQNVTLKVCRIPSLVWFSFFRGPDHEH